jgi:hypothetical protein
MTTALESHNAGTAKISSVIVTVAVALVFGRIVSVTRLVQADWRGTTIGPSVPFPMLGANDRSRWVTVRALLENGSYSIGQRDPATATAKNPAGDTGLVFEKDWKTIDKVLDPQTGRYYSSKPPWLATLVAGECWLLERILGWELSDPRTPLFGIVLLTFNWLPFLAYMAAVAVWARQERWSAWSSTYLLMAAGMGTFTSSFAVTLNNHVPATCAVALALLFLRRAIEHRNEAAATDLLVSGLFAGFAASFDLPALCFGVAGLIVAIHFCGLGRCVVYILGAAIPAAGFLLTNYLALGRLTPIYAEFGGPWYQYAGGYWDPAEQARQGIDFADETKWIYGFHLLLGHHGLFSLTPVLILGALGALSGIVSSRSAYKYAQDRLALPWLAWMCLGTMIIVIAFYIWRTNNYGGKTIGPRWLMWLSPLLLLSMQPVLDRPSQRRWASWLFLTLLALSVASVSYNLANPWVDPWLLDWLTANGWIQY